MDTVREMMTRYLLGELPDEEQTALEEQYFGDPQIFEAVAKVETALVDDYVRGRLDSGTRQRFEQYYMADPRRHERVRFAEALVSRMDRDQRAHEAIRRSSTGALNTFLASLRGPRLATAVALASVLLVAGGIGLVVNARRQEAARIEAARIEQERLARDRERAAARQAQPPGVSTDRGTPGTATPSGLSTRRVVALSLLVGPGERSLTAAAPTLVVPAGTDDVRLDLSLRENAYARYRVVVKAIGGGEILRRGDLTPAAQGPSFTLVVPVNQLPPGDYMLTLQGAERATDFEDLSQSLFRVTSTPSSGSPR